MNKLRKRGDWNVLVLLLILLSVNYNLNGQQSTKNKLYIFAEWSGQDKTYFNRELPYVVFVRDPSLSDVQIMINSMGTAGGGEKHVISLIGHGVFEGNNQKVNYQSGLNNSDEEIRAGITEVLKYALMPYVGQTAIKNSLHFSFNDSAMVDENSETTISLLDEDPWNNWVFEIGGDVWFNTEESQSDYTLRGSFKADQITDKWKIRNFFSYRVKNEEFTDDDDIIRSTEKDYFHISTLVRSIDDHWSAGAFFGTNSSTYNNFDASGHLAPAIEFNFFPWDELDKHELTVAYSPGVRYNRYIDSTIYGQMEQYLAYESVTMRLELIQPWGELQTFLRGSHYFHDPGFYNIELNSELSIRLTKNLSFDFEIRAESIHDQIYLPKGDASREEILLRQRKLATTYELGFEVGFEFTFGSIYNTVVNRRL